jgi:hypothetical protein
MRREGNFCSVASFRGFYLFDRNTNRSISRIAGEATEDHRVERVDVLIPAYLHGGTGYRLAQIREVWESDGDHPAVSFVLDDGSSIFDACCEGEGAHGGNLKLAARF